MPKNALSISKESHQAWSQTKEIVFSNEKYKVTETTLLRQSAISGGIVGEIAGAIIGTVTGALAANLTGILMGFTIGVLLGALTGLLTGIIVSKTAGTNGGPSIGAYSGMGFGAILGTIVGLLIPDSIRMSANTLHTPVLNALVSSRFETISLFAFLLCILGALIGVWVSGRNYKPAKSIR